MIRLHIQGISSVFVAHPFQLSYDCYQLEWEKHPIRGRGEHTGRGKLLPASQLSVIAVRMEREKQKWRQRSETNMGIDRSLLMMA